MGKRPMFVYYLTQLTPIKTKKNTYINRPTKINIVYYSNKILKQGGSKIK